MKKVLLIVSVFILCISLWSLGGATPPLSRFGGIVIDSRGVVLPEKDVLSSPTIGSPQLTDNGFFLLIRFKNASGDNTGRLKDIYIGSEVLTDNGFFNVIRFKSAYGDNAGRLQDIVFGSPSQTDNGFFGYINGRPAADFFFSLQDNMIMPRHLRRYGSPPVDNTMAAYYSNDNAFRFATPSTGGGGSTVSDNTPRLPEVLYKPFSLSTNKLRNTHYDNTLRARILTHMATLSVPVTDPNAPANTTFFPPGQGFTSTFYAGEFRWMLDSYSDIFDVDNIKRLIDWQWYYRINDNTTSYSKNAKTMYYKKGTLPSIIPQAGSPPAFPGYTSHGDLVSVQAPADSPVVFWHWGRLRGFDNVWRAAYDNTYRAGMMEWLETGGWTPYWDNAVGLFRKDAIYDQLGWGYSDGMDLGGVGSTDVGSSVIYYETCLVMAEMEYRSGKTQAQIDYWTNRASAIQRGVNAAFVRVDAPQWDRLTEDFKNYTPFGPNASIMTNWVTTQTGGTRGIVDNPNGQTGRWTVVGTTTGGNINEFKELFNGLDNEYTFQWKNAEVRMMTSDNTHRNYLALNNGTKYVQIIIMGEDGHWKYYNGTSVLNLPTDTIYQVNTPYTVRLAFDWSGKQTTFFIDNVNKGAVGMSDATVDNVNQYTIAANGSTAAGTTNFWVKYLRVWDNVASTVDSGPGGYLPWTTTDNNLNAFGNFMAPGPTAQAINNGILYPANALRAARYLNMIYKQPLTTKGWGTLFLTRADQSARGAVRIGRWSDDINPGYHQSITFTGAPNVYGQYSQGGYWWWLTQLYASALYAYNPATAMEYLENMAHDFDTVGTNAPYEEWDAANSFYGGKYLSSILSATSQALP